MAKVSINFSKVKNFPENTQFIQLSLEYHCSPALKKLSINARKVLDRIFVEHMSHAGKENGFLKVTYNDFVKFGINRNQILKSIKELEKLRFIEVEHGARICYNKSYPNIFTLTMFKQKIVNEKGEVYYVEPSNKWKLISDSKK